MFRLFWNSSNHRIVFGIFLLFSVWFLPFPICNSFLFICFFQYQNFTIAVLVVCMWQPMNVNTGQSQCQTDLNSSKCCFFSVHLFQCWLRQSANSLHRIQIYKTINTEIYAKCTLRSHSLHTHDSITFSFVFAIGMIAINNTLLKADSIFYFFFSFFFRVDYEQNNVKNVQKANEYNNNDEHHQHQCKYQ